MKAGLNLPWTQGESEEGAECVFLGGAVEPPLSMGPDDTWIDCGSKERARLISAAPDLLEALASLVSYCERRGMDTETVSADHMDSARAAILKATGEQA